MTILYAKVGGPPDNWQNLRVTRNGIEMNNVVEVDVLGCWGIVDEVEWLNGVPTRVQTKLYGTWTIEERQSAPEPIIGVMPPGADQNDPGDTQPGHYGVWPVFLTNGMIASVDSESFRKSVWKIMGSDTGRWSSKRGE